MAYYNDTRRYVCQKASKLTDKHVLNIFREKTVKLSKHEFILVIFMKLDKVAHLLLKGPYSLSHCATMGQRIRAF